MSNYRPNNERPYHDSSSDEAEEHADVEYFPAMFSIEYMSNMSQWPIPPGSIPAIPQQPSHQTTSPANRNQLLPSPSPQDASRLPETRVNQPWRNRYILPAPSSEARPSQSHPHQAQGNQGTTRPEGGLMPLLYHSPAAEFHPSERSATAPQGPTLAPLHTNAARVSSASISPRDPSQQGSSTRNRGQLRCTYPYCAYTGTFSRTAELRRHLRNKHTHPESHICPVEGCGSVYSRGDNLRNHMRNVHGRA